LSEIDGSLQTMCIVLPYTGLMLVFFLSCINVCYNILLEALWSNHVGQPLVHFNALLSCLLLTNKDDYSGQW